jgi:Ca2+:H+ antiporter
MNHASTARPSLLPPASAVLRVVAIWLAVAGLAVLDHVGVEDENVALDVILFVLLFGLIMWGAFGVVHHAEELAVRLGEPYGTLVLTLAVTIIEVSFIVSAMLSAGASVTLARDAVFSVLMITLNGVVGACLLLGGLRHREQTYNLHGAQAFLSVVIPLASFALLLPNFTTSSRSGALSPLQSMVIGGLTLALYMVFLAIQTVRHAPDFRDPAEDLPHRAERSPAGAERIVLARETMLLLLTLVPVVLLAEELSDLARAGIAALQAPLPLAGLLVAILVLAPETVGALHAALRNRLQRAVNIILGSALATIGLTIPAVLVLSVLGGVPVTLGLAGEEMLLLLVTLVVSALTFSGGRTNILQGAVHLVMFLVFLLLIFDP